MIDFKKLMDQTPEEREAVQARAAEEFAQRTREVIARRTAQIQALEADDAALNAWERDFVSDMSYKATTYDIAGWLGGNLATLSDKQAENLDRLHAKALKQREAPVSNSPFAQLARQRRG